MQQLKYLDNLEITGESRKVINATVLKKRMYYNMKILTIKRNTAFLNFKLLESWNRSNLEITNEISALLGMQKHVQTMIDHSFLLNVSIIKVAI